MTRILFFALYLLCFKPNRICSSKHHHSVPWSHYLAAWGSFMLPSILANNDTLFFPLGIKLFKFKFLHPNFYLVIFVVKKFGNCDFQKYWDNRKRALKWEQMSAPSFRRTHTAFMENMLMPERGRRD